MAMRRRHQSGVLSHGRVCGGAYIHDGRYIDLCHGDCDGRIRSCKDVSAVEPWAINKLLNPRFLLLSNRHHILARVTTRSVSRALRFVGIFHQHYLREI